VPQKEHGQLGPQGGPLGCDEAEKVLYIGAKAVDMASETSAATVAPVIMCDYSEASGDKSFCDMFIAVAVLSETVNDEDHGFGSSAGQPAPRAESGSVRGDEFEFATGHGVLA
jgi:hypothetical protein